MTDIAGRPDALIYRGERRGDRFIVTMRIDDQTIGPLDPAHHIRNHSPDGFAWGYAGSGPAQLALALLVDASGDEELAAIAYQDFKREQIAVLCGRKGWTKSAASINRWLRNWGKDAA